MKTVEENGIIYIVNDDYPARPITRYPQGTTKKRYILTKYEFRQRLTFDEKRTLKGSADVGTQVLIEDLMAATEVDLNDSGFQLGMLYLNATYPETFTVERIAILSAPEEI